MSSHVMLEENDGKCYCGLLTYIFLVHDTKHLLYHHIQYGFQMNPQGTYYHLINFNVCSLHLVTRV